jgi:hypothetical protein
VCLFSLLYVGRDARFCPEAAPRIFIQFSIGGVPVWSVVGIG